MRVLGLFSGIGGFELGLQRAGFEIAAMCEIDPFCRRVLAKHWPDVFIHDDVRTLNKDTLCKGYAENALLNQLCKEMGGNRVSVSSAITHIKKREGKKPPPTTTNGPWSAEEALSIIMAGNVPAAENANTHFWQSITLLITETMRGQDTRELCGSSLSSADFLTTIKFFVTIATRQRQSTAPAHIRDLLRVPIYEDVRELTGERLAADGVPVDVICGGFPCQDISVAGKGAGLAGERSGLWREYARIIGELQPRFVIVENVAALLGRGLAEVLGDLSSLGYDAEWHCIPAAAVGAPHRRDRLWIVANAVCKRGWFKPISERQRGGATDAANDGAQGDVAHSAGERRRQRRTRRPDSKSKGLCDATSPLADTHCKPVFGAAITWPERSAWDFEPEMGRVVDGVPHRLVEEELRALGNAVVPQIPELIGKAIKEAIGTVSPTPSGITAHKTEAVK